MPGEKTLVLNFLFKPSPYDQALKASAQNWMEFFSGQDIHVIGTPPTLRAGDVRSVAPSGVEVIPVQGFDTCCRWRVGFEHACEKDDGGDYIYLWSADFDFDEPAKRAATDLLGYGGNEDLVVGTIQAKGTKQAVDDLATYPLVENWFPDEFDEMRHRGLTKPRSELLRISRRFACSALKRRWYPTEQTIHLILQCIWSAGDYGLSCLPLPRIADSAADRLSRDVVAQAERMELWLRYIWRERHKDWNEQDYAHLSANSWRILSQANKGLLKVVQKANSSGCA